MDNLDVRLLSVENEELWHAISPNSTGSFNLIKKGVERSYG